MEIHTIEKLRIKEKLKVKTINKNVSKCPEENKSRKFAFRKNNEITKS